MLKQKLLQKGQYKLSPNQIKLMKLVQLSTLDFEEQIKQELEENPVLEEIKEDDFTIIDNNTTTYNIDLNSSEKKNKINIDEYFNDYKIFNFKNKKNYNINEEKSISIISGISFQEYLKNQLHTFRFLKKKDLLIADFILGYIDDNGYIRRKISSIVDDIYLIMGISVTVKKIKKLLINYIQKLDPIGIGASNLQECLLIQLQNKKKTKDIILAKNIIQNYFEFFVKKNYQKLQTKLVINKKNLRKSINEIEKLNPKPGKIYSGNSINLEYIIPDFTINIIDGKLNLFLNNRNSPKLKISSLYIKMLKFYKKNIKKNVNIIRFLEKKIDSAKWLVDAIKKRKNTLMLTMNAIMNYQKEYFLTGDTYKIKPMILKNISKKIGVGISTVSRVANSKYINTPYGTFLIKSFFSEKIINKKGKEISSIKIKKFLKEYINKENKKNPLTDEKLSKILQKKGYSIARRTISKYRDQMKIPISKMRKII
ncbi:RNA polymerase factor sigma-54 [Blattabacterium cuenoti]|uniref:RNA polymerase factor sigma-54 n=1 Tax=Blattabacterium cuenoti TaxID=1653831 RepID=UPI00163C9730|nr:RNA polymerase factor sigma-54 [Blattabacterium cuenoti]